MVKNIIYLLTCNLCGAQYVGEMRTAETPPNMGTLQLVVYKSVTNGSTKTAMGTHLVTNHR